MSKVSRNLIIGATAIAGAYGIMRIVAAKRTEDKEIDKDNPYLRDIRYFGSQDTQDEHGSTDDTEGGKDLSATVSHLSHSERSDGQSSESKDGLYVSIVKPALDKALSFVGLIVLAPLYAAISLAVFIDDPGPVFFTQKRVGKDGRFFMLHKYRTMKLSTPHDVPTHMLQNPEQYITKVGRVLRKTSLDELPQIWDIFRGCMSIIGPRPALWNQDDLVAERSKYSANNVLPGLTGLAQIKGRDELEIPDKAELDGKYVSMLKKGGLRAFFFDVQMFFGTITSVLRHDGIVEGGTGSFSAPSNAFQTARTRGMEPINSADVGFENYGHKKTFNIDKNKYISVLITGAGSYIGESFKSYCEEHYPNIAITVIDMVDGLWHNYSFRDDKGRSFDTVFHVAGIAHADVGDVSLEQQNKYYDVNSTLAIETAKKAKEAGCSQFIYMSSMIIYGAQEYIDEHTMPAPANFYGDSKWKGDRGVRALQDSDFAVAVLRPPMIYGKGSKGNYPILAKIAEKVPIFPKVGNYRSMLYIENLCEFVSLLALSGESGIYFPQNAEYSNTSELVVLIGEVIHKPVHLSGIFAPAVWIAQHAPIKKIKGLANKALGSSYYDTKLSIYEGLDYRRVSLYESIRRTAE